MNNWTSLDASRYDCSLLSEREFDAALIPGVGVPLTRQVEELQRRQSDLSQLTPTLAAIARPQMPHAEDLIGGLGSLSSVEFKRVGPGGADIFTVKFARGSVEWWIFLDADGKVAMQFFRPHHSPARE
jgi:hypothetical protein